MDKQFLASSCLAEKTATVAAQFEYAMLLWSALTCAGEALSAGRRLTNVAADKHSSDGLRRNGGSLLAAELTR